MFADDIVIFNGSRATTKEELEPLSTNGKTLHNGEPAQELPTYQNYSKGTTTNHSGGPKRTHDNI